MKLLTRSLLALITFGSISVAAIAQAGQRCWTEQRSTRPAGACTQIGEARNGEKIWSCCLPNAVPTLGRQRNGVPTNVVPTLGRQTF